MSGGTLCPSAECPGGHSARGDNPPSHTGLEAVPALMEAGGGGGGMRQKGWGILDVNLIIKTHLRQLYFSRVDLLILCRN